MLHRDVRAHCIAEKCISTKRKTEMMYRMNKVPFQYTIKTWHIFVCHGVKLVFLLSIRDYIEIFGKITM